MKRTNTVADVLNTGKAKVDVGNGVILDLPLNGVYAGEPGPPGAGVPAGGTALQNIRKNAAGTTTEWYTPNKADLGLGDVNNTSDTDKPVSTAQATAIAGKVGKGDLVINVLDYGTPTDVDDTAMLQAAANAAKVAKVPLFVPNGVRLRVTAPVDLRYIDVVFDGFLTVANTTDYGVLVGDSSNVRVSRTISFKSALHADNATQTNPCIRVMGLMAGLVTMGRCDYLQLYANATTEPVTGKSNAYSTYIFTGGSIRHLELFGDTAQSWINENIFVGGDFRKITIRGDYTHNSNKFLKPSLEGSGSLLDIQRGARNEFKWARGEYGPTVRFGVDTWRNIVEDGWSSNPQSRTSGFVVDYDLGTENVVTTSADTYLHPHELVKISANSVLLDTAWGHAGGKVRPGVKLLKVDTSFGQVINSGILPIKQGTVMLRRIEIRSDAALWRPRVRFYDAAMNRLDLSTGPFMDLSGAWTIGGTNEYYQFGVAVSTATVLVTSSTPAYMSIEVQSGSSTAGVAFEYLKVTGFIRSPQSPALVEQWKQDLCRPLFGTGVPTQGNVPKGTTIETATNRIVAVERAQTTTTAAAASGATTVSVASVTGMLAGDVIGVLLTDGTTHWTTIASIASLVVTLTTALTGAAPSGAQVVTNRWATR